MSPTKGASPRSTRSRLTATNSWSGTVRCPKSSGNTIGRMPSRAWAWLTAARTASRQVAESSSPLGRADLGVVGDRFDVGGRIGDPGVRLGRRDGAAMAGESRPPSPPAPPSRCTSTDRRRRETPRPGSPPAMTRHDLLVNYRPRGPNRLPSRGGPLRIGAGRSGGRPSSQTSATSSTAARHCPDRRSTSTGNRHRGRCRRHRSTPGSPRSMPRPRRAGSCADSAACWAPRSRAGESPGKGASPRSTRSSSTATKSCSGTLSWAKLAGSTIGPTPSSWPRRVNGVEGDAEAGARAVATQAGRTRPCNWVRAVPNSQDRARLLAAPDSDEHAAHSAATRASDATARLDAPVRRVLWSEAPMSCSNVARPRLAGDLTRAELVASSGILSCRPGAITRRSLLQEGGHRLLHVARHR